ncbi:hypothetical protein [Sporomusa sp.]|uniref:hypothetical protein n=1 Tax=Sporomusa sp. TaxID=2078658 RepID=UPI002B9121FA|nr:hypothetical protein [Sporomusa sp.]HWR43659.1 hypothetical protein [Sporomusa sp.]
MITKHLRGQNGSATIFAVMAMVVLLGMAALSTSANNILFLSTDQVKLAQANFAAETGIRASTLILNNSIKGYTGTDINTRYTIPTELNDGNNYLVGLKKSDGTSNTDVYYNVSVTMSGAPTPGQPLIYTFNVRGHGESNIQRTLIAQYRVDIPNSGGSNTPPPPDVTPLPYAVYNQGNKLVIEPNFNINNGTIVTNAKSNQVVDHNTRIDPLFYEKYLDLPPIPVSLNWKDYDKYSENNPPTQSGDFTLSGNYYDTGFSTNQDTTYYAKDGNHVVIFSKGQITLGGNITTDKKTNFIIISDHGITVNGNAILTGNFQFYAKQPIIINGKINGYSLLMSEQDITLNSGAQIIKGVAIAGGDFTMNDNTTITGSVTAGKKLTLGGGTLNYDANVITDWGK